MQRLVYLLAMRREGHTPGKRIRPSGDLQARYRLVVSAAERGSLQLPIQLQGADLLFPAQGAAVIDDLKQLLALGERGDADAFRKTIDDETWQRFLLDGLERVAPHPNFGVTLTISQGGNPICHADKLRGFTERLLRAPTSSGRQAIVGTLMEISFELRRIKLRHRRTQRLLSCSYEDAVEASLLEHPREDVIVFGIMSLNAGGEVEQIDRVDHIEPVDLSAISIDVLQHGNEWIKSRIPLKAIVEFNEKDGLYEAGVEELDLSTYGETREALKSALEDELSMLWHRYALAEDLKLTPKAQVLKRRMLAFFGGDDAAEST